MFLHKLVKTLKVMKNLTFSNIKYWLLLAAIALSFSCNYAKPQLTPDEIWHVQRKVTRLTKNIEKDLSAKGPSAWINYVQDTANFFMANDGKLAFKDSKSAIAFIRDTLVKNTSKINLQWNNMRVDPLSNSIASIGSDYHEEATDKNGKTITWNGYFTATAVLIDDNWKLRNMHWSSVPAK
jgi:hypothetical protein